MHVTKCFLSLNNHIGDVMVSVFPSSAFWYLLFARQAQIIK
jgi:hypothetical protein